MSEQFKLNTRAQSISDRIFSKIDGKVDTSGNLDKDLTKSVFREIATEDGRNVEQMIDDQNYISDFVLGSTHAGSKAVERRFKETKDLGTAALTFELGRSVLDVSFERHKRVPNRVLDKESGNFVVDGEKDVYGQTNVKFSTYGAKNSRGELSKLRDNINLTFTSAFGS
ncbi:hypothetical protein AVU38_gp031 [Ralstonia phage RSL2]|uniref:Uncharacterized protein n=1 Tax=Ralstonia phage RSL2 TaxID=1585840 RepID=A0A0A8J9A7_9CAUD|nr:hypothetical protein AVU38_gp031 [Ralstonia phage RSL2]BAQ02559.1 hypothetical protein [Ralstonia phage RSL2]